MEKDFSKFLIWYHDCYFNGMRMRYTKGWDNTLWKEIIGYDWKETT